MTKKQIRAALAKDVERKRGKRAERIVVQNYPYSHNPYLPHEPHPDCSLVCLPNCMLEKGGN